VSPTMPSIHDATTADRPPISRSNWQAGLKFLKFNVQTKKTAQIWRKNSRFWKVKLKKMFKLRSSKKLRNVRILKNF
jgi:hypothetical protein